MQNWIWVLDSYAGQMAERERLIDACPDRVHALFPEATEAAAELLALVLRHLPPEVGFRQDADGRAITCPDGRRVRLDRSAPLLTLGRIVQEDLCLLQKPQGGAEHLLAGAILCFPASWTLSEKLGHPMTAIHRPVRDYDPDLARRVERMLDGVRPGRPLTRSNAFLYEAPDLFQPRRESDPRPAGDAGSPFFRSERQCLVRLPETGAVAFSIHTILMPSAALTDEDLRALC